jgi:hypothetical protein
VEHSLLIFDDVIYNLTNEHYFLNLAIGEAHHSLFSVCIVSQTLHPPGKYTKDITSQCSYTLLFKLCNDLTAVKRFAKKITADNEDYFIASYLDCVATHYSPMLIDCEQTTPHFLQLRGNLAEDVQTGYPAL